MLDPVGPAPTTRTSHDSPPPAVSSSRLVAMEDALLAWYAENKRPLPWRETRDPYAILVSEVMLQQTQVERVLPRWVAWLERWPTPAGFPCRGGEARSCRWGVTGSTCCTEMARMVLAVSGTPGLPAHRRTSA